MQAIPARAERESAPERSPSPQLVDQTGPSVVLQPKEAPQSPTSPAEDPTEDLQLIQPDQSQVPGPQQRLDEEQPTAPPGEQEAAEESAASEVEDDRDSIAPLFELALELVEAIQVALQPESAEHGATRPASEPRADGAAVHATDGRDEACTEAQRGNPAAAHRRPHASSSSSI